ncbi:MAG TPA: polymer-forming cytoskeletal protein [Candidatus Limnocylindrales bacterium]|nr:polymer-forming cytoskeletal protein [Candidatus Limnocylindrales bacterium]
MEIQSPRGSVLIITLFMVSILYLLGISLLLLSFTETTLSDLEVRSMQSLYLAESALAEGLAKLRTNPDYRTDLNDTLPIGTNVGLYSVKFYDGTNDGNGYYRPALSPFLYQIILAGKGTVPGFRTSAQTEIEAEVVLKPFVMLSEESLDIRDGSVIQGNIHANQQVTLSPASTVTGNVTTSGSLTNQGTVTGVISFLEPSIRLPVLTTQPYYPTYTYQGTTYSAQKLTSVSVPLPNPPGNPPPYPNIEFYQGTTSSGNPAGVYYVDEPITASLVQIDLTGTLILLPSAGDLNISGAVRITPVGSFPAILSSRHLQIRMMGNLSSFGVTGNLIQGLIYTDGDILLIGEDLSGRAVEGMLIAHGITTQGIPNLQINYTPSILSNPPPDLDLIEVLSWKQKE